MSKILLLRIYDDGIVSALYSDGIEITGLEKIKNWCQERIADKRAMEQKGRDE